jgi:acid-sensing ion channel 5
MIVFVHNSSYKPIDSDGVKVKPGEIAYISVSRTLTVKQPTPYSSCIDLAQYSSKYFDYIVKQQQKAYRQSDCFELCYQEKAMSKCGCYDLRFANINTNVTIPPCLNWTQLDCITSTYYKYDYSECASLYCPLECEKMTLDTRLSNMQAPSYRYYLSLGPDITDEYSYAEYRSFSLSIKVFYPTLSYTTMYEMPKVSLTDLLAQIGGSLGMFVSFSVFSFFELIEIFILLICALIKSD